MPNANNNGSTLVQEAIEVRGEGSVNSILHSAMGVVLRRRRMLTAISGTIFALLTVVIALMPSKYEATALVKIDPTHSAAMGQMTDQTSLPDTLMVDTEANVMQSKDVIRAVVNKLDLANDPDLNEGVTPLPANASPDERAAYVDSIVDNVIKELTVSRDKSTYIVSIAYDSPNPRKAAQIANSIAEAYIESSVGRRSGTAERQAQGINEDLKKLSDQATAADQALAQYRAQTGLVDTSGGNQSVTDKQVGPIATSLATAEALAAEANSAYAVAKAQQKSGGIESVSAVLSSDVVHNLRIQRATLLSAKAEADARYGPKHPETIKIVNQLNEIDQQISAEANRIVAGLQNAATAATAQSQSLRGSLNQLRSAQSTDLRYSAAAETLKAKAATAHDSYSILAARAQAIGQIAASSLSQAQIVEAATAPDKPSKPKRLLLLLASLLGSVSLGLAVIAAQEVVSAGMQTSNELRTLGLRMLAAVPKLDLHESMAEQEVVTQPMGAFAEAYRMLRRAINVSELSSQQVIIVTSALPQEGKTASALSLAQVMAMAGSKVVVVDTDVRHPSIGKRLNTDGEVGIVEVIRGEVDIETAIVSSHVPNLDVIPVANSLFSPEDLFAGEAFEKLIADLRTRYQYVVLDSPPLLGIADARVIAKVGDAVVMAVRWGATPRGAVEAALEFLRIDGAKILGAIYTIVDATSENYGVSYYSSKYKNYYVEGE